MLGASFAEIARRHGATPPPPLQPRAPGAPAAVVQAVMRCLAKRPDDRWPDGEALRDALLGEGTAHPGRPSLLRRARRLLGRRWHGER
jgi:hypothetical protein